MNLEFLIDISLIELLLIVYMDITSLINYIMNRGKQPRECLKNNFKYYIIIEMGGI